MNRKKLMISGSIIIFTVLFVIAYLLFIVFDITKSDLRIYKLTIVTESSEKIYDGMPLENDNWHITSGTLRSNHRIEHTMNSSITNVGSIKNNIFITILDENNYDVTDNYQLVYHLGDLVVNPIELTIYTASSEKYYDGTPLTSDTWYLTRGYTLSGHSIHHAMNASITEPGTTANTIGLTILDESNQDVTSNYQMYYVLGDLVVKPILLTISTGSLEKYYDGTPLTSNVWSIYSGVLLENHSLQHVMNTSIIYPGSIANEIGITIFDEFGKDVTAFYQITHNLGVLTIFAYDLMIQTESLEKDYDGLPLTSDTWNLYSGVLLEGHTIRSVMNSMIINPGSVTNEIGITVVDQNNRDVSYIYNIIYDLGLLSVRPIVITLSSESASKIYDGLPLSNNNWELLYGNVLENHTLHVTLNQSITDVGSIPNYIYSYVLDRSGNNVSYIYQFDYFMGSLTVFSSSYSSGDISKEGFESPDFDAFRYYTEQSEPIYFRGNSYGDYRMTGWESGETQNTGITINPINFAGYSLMNLGLNSHTVQIDYLRSQIPYLVPYFPVDPLDGVNDVYIQGNTSDTASFNYFSYAYQEGDYSRLQNRYLHFQELTYRSYVYDQYLQIPDSTRYHMLNIASQNRLYTYSPSLITDVQKYIQNAAVYNLNFEKIPDDVEDIAVYFLTVSKEGICQHYATAATLMYRALGVPARYVTGYFGKTVANDWTTVTGEFAHAWVEIYIDGFGWMPIEVTAGGPSSEGSEGEDGEGGSGGGTGGEDGEGGSGGDEEPDFLGEIVVTPSTVREEYIEGITIAAQSVTLQGFQDFSQSGFTYQVTFSGELSEPGLGVSRIASFVIYDNLGEDVTSKFEIELKEGILHLYIYEIELLTNSDIKMYDGTHLTNHSWSINGTLGAGHYVYEAIISGSQTNVGYSKNRASLIIYDQNNQNVTHLYRIIGIYGDLFVTPRSITIESNSAQKPYDGSPLIDRNYQIVSGSLASTDVIFEIIISGSQTSIGKSENTIDSLIIYRQGVDVTYNYVIDFIQGELVVSPY